MYVNYLEQMEELLTITAQQGASDLHLSANRYPAIRVDNNLIFLTNKNMLAVADIEGLVYSILSEEQRARYEKEKELDLSYDLKEKARFRVNIYTSQSHIAAAFRLIPTHIRNIAELNLPNVLRRFTSLRQGFFLSAGPAGHGKTTTLAAMVDEINHSRSDHIITIEDPIEYVYTPDRSIINQREVYTDTLSFHQALKSSLRQDPNVIMVGEMRDPETMSTAITAAETGHFVLSTLHTNNAAQTIDRIVDSFPPFQQNQIRMQLAATLVGIVSQRLMPRISGGRIPAVEVLIVNNAAQSLIRAGKTHELGLVIDTGLEDGMMSLNRSLADLVGRREISMEDALNYSMNVEELRSLLGQ